MAPNAGPPPVRVGEYQLFGLIGTGGMASVHIGVKRAPDGASEVVAIKRLHPHLLSDPLVVTSFHDEARIASLIRHENVVELLAVVSETGELSLVMEYVEGESLAKLLALARRKGHPPPLCVSVAIAVGVLRGLHAAHEAKGDDGAALAVVHRDVSPENILIAGDGTPKLADFGVAKALGRLQTTREGGLKGKCAYMAPEQIRGVGVTRKTDIFAAGAVLYELVTGSRLFDGDDEATILSKALFDPLPRVRDRNPDVPPSLEAVIENALDRDPTGRFHSADEMADALEEALPAGTKNEVATWTMGVAREVIEARRSERERAVLSLDESWRGANSVTTSRRTVALRASLVLALSAVVASVLVAALRHRDEVPESTHIYATVPPPLRHPSAATPTAEIPATTTNAAPIAATDTAPSAPPGGSGEPMKRHPPKETRPKHPPPATATKGLYSRD